MVPPIGIATGALSDVTAIDDPLAARAMQFIRELIADGIAVGRFLQGKWQAYVATA